MNEQSRFNSTKERDANEHHSIPNLIRQLANDVNALFTKEVALVKSEVIQALDEAKKGMISMVSGGSVLYAGFLFLLLAAVLGLGSVMDMWLAALIVGGTVLVVGLIMVQAGRKKLETEKLKPQHTVNTLHKDRNTVRGTTS